MFRARLTFDRLAEDCSLGRSAVRSRVPIWRCNRCVRRKLLRLRLAAPLLCTSFGASFAPRRTYLRPFAQVRKRQSSPALRPMEGYHCCLLQGISYTYRTCSSLQVLHHNQTVPDA